MQDLADDHVTTPERRTKLARDSRWMHEGGAANQAYRPVWLGSLQNAHCE
jgi:hypothetical protein